MIFKLLSLFSREKIPSNTTVTYSEVFWAYRYLQTSGLREAVTHTVAPYQNVDGF